MKPLAMALVCVAVLVACDPSTPTLTTSPPGATSTTIEGDTCGRLVTDTARHLELVVRVLDETSLEEFRHRERWPEALLALEEQGRDLDTRARALRCDVAAVQSAAFAEARLDPKSGLSRYMLRLLGLE